MTFPTPQDAEDAFYDAIEENNHDAMMKVWANSPDTMCLLPMHPVAVGIDAISDSWHSMMQSDMPIEIAIKHLHWTEEGELAIHLVEESISVGPEKHTQPPIYGTNIYRKGADGWQLLAHLNAPAPPPPPGTIPAGTIDPASLPPEMLS